MGLYAIDGQCHNAQLGTYGHECGQRATWVGTNAAGHAMGFCDRCKVDGHEARDVTSWRRIAPWHASEWFERDAAGKLRFLGYHVTKGSETALQIRETDGGPDRHTMAMQAYRRACELNQAES